MRPPQVEAVFFPTSLCVGFLFLILYPDPPPPPPPPPPPLVTHNFVTHNFVTLSFTHNIVTHTTCSHIALSYTTLSHTLFHTHKFVTHNLLTHRHNFVTHSLSHTTLSHTTLSLDLRFAWQAWRLLTPTFVLRGRRGTYETGLALVASMGAASRPWRRGTLRGRRGTWWHRPSFCVAGVALMTLGWPWWRAWAQLVARGAAALCVAGVALGDIDVSFAWHLVTSTLRVSPSLSNKTLLQTILPQTHTHRVFHTYLSHMQLCRTQLCQTQLFRTNIF